MESISGNAKANPRLGTRAKRAFGFRSIIPFWRGTTHPSKMLPNAFEGPLQPPPSSPVAVELPHLVAPYRLPQPPALAEEPGAVELPGSLEKEDVRVLKRHLGARRPAISAQRIRQRLLASANSPGRVGTDGEQVPPLVLPSLERRTRVSTRRRSTTQPSFNDRYECGVEFRPDGYGYGSSSGSTTIGPAAGGLIPRPDHAYHSPAV